MAALNIQVSPTDQAKTALRYACYQLLFPVVRLLLRHGMPFQSFVQIAKRVYCEVAQESEFQIGEREVTKSRIALLTGLTRPDVTSTCKSKNLDELPSDDKWSRCSILLTAWAKEKQFLSTEGKPKILPLKGINSFQVLCKQFGNDIVHSTMLEELLRVGCVEMVDTDYVKFKSFQYVAHPGSSQLLKIVGVAGSRLLSTIEHNILRSQNLVHGREPEAFFQQEVWSRSIPPEKLEEYSRELRCLLKKYVVDVTDYMTTIEDNLPDYHHAKAGVGFYYFEFNQ